MKNVMKINKLVTACILAGSLGICSCSDFLDQMPKTALTEQEALSDLENIIPTVDGLYTAFREAKSDVKDLLFHCWDWTKVSRASYRWTMPRKPVLIFIVAC